MLLRSCDVRCPHPLVWLWRSSHGPTARRDLRVADANDFDCGVVASVVALPRRVDERTAISQGRECSLRCTACRGGRASWRRGGGVKLNQLCIEYYCNMYIRLHLHTLMCVFRFSFFVFSFVFLNFPLLLNCVQR